MIKFKINQIKKITFKEIKLFILTPGGENDKHIFITYLPTFVPPATTKRYPIEKRYPIAIEEGTYYIKPSLLQFIEDKIKPNLLQFIEELYSATSLGHKGIIVIGIPWHLYLSTDFLEGVNDIHDLVLLCNDKAYEKYKQKECTKFISDSVLNMVDDYIKRTEYSDVIFNLGGRNGKQKLIDDIKNAFTNFEPKVYTHDDWLDTYKFEIISYFENEIKENEKMPTKDFERIEGINIVGTCNGFTELDDFINERNKMKIDKVIFNKPATIVFWKDGTKTVVKADGEKFDPEKGLAMAISKKAYGNKGDYYDVFRKWIKGDIKGGKKKK